MAAVRSYIHLHYTNRMVKNWVTKHISLPWYRVGGSFKNKFLRKCQYQNVILYENIIKPKNQPKYVLYVCCVTVWVSSNILQHQTIISLIFSQIILKWSKLASVQCWNPGVLCKYIVKIHLIYTLPLLTNKSMSSPPII